MSHPVLSESKRRLYEKLYHDLGQEIHACLQDDDIHEVMLNPDSRLWIDSPTQGLMQTSRLSSVQAFAIIHSLAGIHGFVLDQHNPQLEADLPFFKTMQGERFMAQVPPIVSAPCFTIRKKSNVVFSLDDYVDSGRLTTKQADVLKNLVQQRSNILVTPTRMGILIKHKTIRKNSRILIDNIINIAIRKII